MRKKTNPDVYKIITNQIIELLESGVIPWRKPWDAEKGAPCNLLSGQKYRGINTFLLSCFGGSKYWLAFNQTKNKGGRVMKGAKGVPVIFWNWVERNNLNESTGEMTTEKTPLIRYYTVFNLDQIEGIDEPTPEETFSNPKFTLINEAQSIIDNMPQRPVVKHGENRAFYRPSEDLVFLPEKKDFEGPEEYYNTVFHELIHSTGHEIRLNRKEVEGVHFFGSSDYSREELVAEMGAAYLSGYAGIERKTVMNSAAYIQSWLKQLRTDKKLVIVAAAQAQKAADFILQQQE